MHYKTPYMNSQSHEQISIEENFINKKYMEMNITENIIDLIINSIVNTLNDMIKNNFDDFKLLELEKHFVFKPYDDEQITMCKRRRRPFRDSRKKVDYNYKYNEKMSLVFPLSMIEECKSFIRYQNQYYFSCDDLHIDKHGYYPRYIINKGYKHLDFCQYANLISNDFSSTQLTSVLNDDHNFNRLKNCAKLKGFDIKFESGATTLDYNIMDPCIIVSWNMFDKLYKESFLHKIFKNKTDYELYDNLQTKLRIYLDNVYYKSSIRAQIIDNMNKIMKTTFENEFNIKLSTLDYILVDRYVCNDPYFNVLKFKLKNFYSHLGMISRSTDQNSFRMLYASLK